MEIEFDKEIDAILRKARFGVDVVPKGEHLDADAVAAFAENALPAKVKSLYMAHFADCGRCRTILVETVAWPPTEKPAAVVTPVLANSTSWISRLFRTPNLAFVAGGLVLIFGGVLGYIVLQNRNRDSNASVAQVTEQAPQGGPFAAEAYPTEANANASMSNAANTAKPVSNTTATNSAPSGTATGTVDRGPESTDETVAGDTPAAAVEQPVAAAPPPPVASKSAPKPEDRREKTDEDKARDDKESSNMAYDGVSRAKKVAGPQRNVGPRNQQNINDNLSMTQNVTGGARSESAVKSAGGKKFENRDGAWYDTGYHGQATKNVARGSEDYRKLDSGLRSIASSIGGVVVVMWKGAAYRIQ